MSALAEFQNAFARTLYSPQAAGRIGQPGFAVYRNTAMKACIDALQANYPAVSRLTGDEWFRAAAARYVRESPPDDPALLRYGATFPAFLARFEPARELPYLPGVATLDRFWTEVHIARDEPALEVVALMHLPPAKLAAAVLYPHAAARWAWFPEAPVFSIWSRNRTAADITDEPWAPPWQAEGALLTRENGAVVWRALDHASFIFLESFATGATLSTATTHAMAAQPDVNLERLMAALLRSGAFNRISATNPLK